MAFDNPENPTIMENFIRALGAEPVVYPYRNECCGGYISLKEKEMAQNMCEKIMDSAKGFEADMLITACPLCMYNLKKNGNGDLPVYYFTELLAEALGGLYIWKYPECSRANQRNFRSKSPEMYEMRQMLRNLSCI